MFAGPLAAEEIGIIRRGNPDAFFRALDTGMKRAAKDFDVHLIMRNPSERTLVENSGVQLQLIQYMLRQNVSAIVLVPETLSEIPAPVTTPVPLVLTDRESVQFQAHSTVASDNFAAGRTAALSLAPALHKGANVVMLRLSADVVSTTQREEGFLSVAREKGWNVKSDVFVQIPRREAEERIAETLHSYPGQIDAVFTPCEMVTAATIRTLEKWPQRFRPHLVGFDWRPSFRQALENGILDFTVLQDPETMGYRSVAQAVAAARGKSAPAKVNIDVTVATRENVRSDPVRALAATYETE